MSWSAPKVAARWLKISDRSQEVLCISRDYHWVSHWDNNERRSRKCGGRQCYVCAIGVQKQLRVVVMVVTTTGQECLLELRERHREQFDRYESMVGLRLVVRKAGAANNSPVDIRIKGQEHAVERDISRLVETLGLPSICVADEDELEALSRPPRSGDEHHPFLGSGEAERST